MKVSVIIPTYKRPERLWRAINALTVLGGQVQDYEIVVVKDGEEGSGFEGRVRIFGIPHSGPAAARNFGVEKARGEYLIFTNDDVVVDSGFIDAHYSALSGGDKIATIGDTKLMRNRYGWLLKMLGLGGYEYGPGFNSFSTINLGIAKKHFKPFDEGFPYAAFEDNELGYRLMKDGLKLVYVPEAKAVHYHEYTLKEIVKRQYELGYSLESYMLGLHPELRKFYKEPGIWNIAKWWGYNRYKKGGVR